MPRRFRYLAVREDAADGCELYAAVPLPPWWCDCGTVNEGKDIACHYCGRINEEADESAADEEWEEVLEP